MRLLVAISAGVLLASMSSQAFSARKYGMAGCGLGSIVMGPKGGQISAATTNATFYSQIFGITSGTSNCIPAKKQAAMIEQQKFMMANLSTLERETAQGDGETVRALSQTFGCNAVAYPEFSKALQASHERIFAQPGAVAVWEQTVDEISANPALAQQCDKLI